MAWLACFLLSSALFCLTAGQQMANVSCDDLLPGQYVCLGPEIDNTTQAAAGCNASRVVAVPCFPSAGTFCNGRLFDGSEPRGEAGFYQLVPCRNVGSKSYAVAVGLSFLGMFGVDRMYLGYPALGLLKLCTFGFFMLGQLVDMVLIAAQVVGPVDGSDYQIDFYGPILTNVRRDGNTFLTM